MKLTKLSVGIAPFLSRKPPSANECIIVGTAWKEQLTRVFPPPTGAYIRLEPSYTSSGIDYSVIVEYNEDNDIHRGWSCDLEQHIPVEWDEQALAWLAGKNWLSNIKVKENT
jgi:hypothetical protein